MSELHIYQNARFNNKNSVSTIIRLSEVLLGVEGHSAAERMSMKISKDTIGK